jgi:putative ABC transport system permease protein
LAEGGRTGTSGVGRQRLRAGLVIAEVALAITLMVSAGLLVRSFVGLISVDPGFRKENLLALQVFAWDRNTTPEKRAAFFRETLDRLDALPGVIAAGAATAPPFFLKSDMAINLDITIEGRGTAQQPLSVFQNTVTPTYFQAMGIPLRAGRTFSDQDVRASTAVALINDTLARQSWPNQNPIGQRITPRFGGSREIVGVVGDVRHGGLDQAARPEVFIPHAQSGTGSMTYVVRTASDPAPLMQRVKAEIWAVDRLQTFYATGVMEDLIDSSLVERRFTLTLLGIFAGVALFLAIVGLYGVVSLLTTQRTNEIGVRVALGASTRDILQLVVGHGIKLVLVGIVVGLFGAFLTTRLLTTLLFGVTPTDPSTFLLAGALLLIVAAGASLIPARRAARIDPLVALRYE